MTRKRNPHRGSSFGDFLKDEGAYEEAQASAIKRVLARPLRQAMEREAQDNKGPDSNGS